VIVAGTSLIASLIVPGPGTPTAEAVLGRDPRWVAPLLWRSEFLSVLTHAMDAGTMTLDEATAAWTRARKLMERGEFMVDGPHILREAAETGRGAHACEFAAAAHLASAPLVTSDAETLAAFPDIAVSPADFVRG
jgi:predicted nucleic acid-binding protein